MRIAKKLSYNYLENQNKQLTLNNLNNNNGEKMDRLYAYEKALYKSMKNFYTLKERFQKDANLVKWCLDNNQLEMAGKYNAKMSATSYCMNKIN